MLRAPKFGTRSNRRAIREITLASALVASITIFIAPRANSQDLGEIARQERAKKQNNPAAPPTHVYTNDDLKRQEILTPEDKSRFSATNQPAPAKPAPSTAQSPTQSTVQSAAQSTPLPPTPNPVAAPATASSVPLVPTTAPTTRPAAAASSPVTSVATTANFAAPITVPLDQMPLGDVARYYRAKKRAVLQAEDTEANGRTVAADVLTPSAPSVATTLPASIPTPIVTAEPTAAQLAQMPLGDVARYYRAKKLQDAATTITLSVSTTVLQGPSTSRYPMTVVAPPLASMKSPPARGALPGNAVSRHSVPRSRSSATPVTGSRTGKSRSSKLAPLTPKYVPKSIPKTGTRFALPQATSVRVARGDTLWQLARRYLGSGARWTELLALNPTLQDPRRLQVGAQLVLHPTT